MKGMAAAVETDAPGFLLCENDVVPTQIRQMRRRPEKRWRWLTRK
jgi:hypothetical protein